MHHARLFPILLRFLCLLLLASAGTLHAQAVVTWGTPTTISGDSNVSTTGTLILAYNFTDDGSDAVVNGVTFTAVAESTTNLTFTTNGGGFYANSSAFGSSETFYTNLSTGYQTLLQSSVYWDLSDTSVVNRMTFNNLTSGNTYYVQLWVNDSRGDYSDRVDLISDGSGHEVQLRFDAGTGAQSLGQFVTGTFVADGTTQELRVSAYAGNAIQFNALTLSTAIPEPSTYAIFAGLGALGFAGLRRRRSA